MTGTTGQISSPLMRGSMESAQKDLRSILAKIDKLGPFARSFVLLRASSKHRLIRLRIRPGHLWILALVFLWIVGQTTRKFLDTYRYDKCLVELPAITRKVFRPPEDCMICNDVHRVEKLSNVDPQYFEERYAYSGRPVVVTDAMSNWTAPQVFTYSFFKSLYDSGQSNCQFFPYKTEFRHLQDVFNMSQSRSLLESGTKPWYVGWSNCDGKIGTILRQHYQRPYFLPLTAESEKTDWIFMGSPGYGAPMHVDDVQHPSWQAQIRGEKLWILEPPRECYYTCKRLEVIVQTGEIIILDTNRWYHQTRIVSEDMSITIGAEFD